MSKIILVLSTALMCVRFALSRVQLEFSHLTMPNIWSATKPNIASPARQSAPGGRVVESAYRNALEFVLRNPYAAAADSLAQLVLALWIGMRVCSAKRYSAGLDAQSLQIAVDIVNHYVHYGEDAELREVGAAIYSRYSSSWVFTQLTEQLDCDGRFLQHNPSNHPRTNFSV